MLIPFVKWRDTVVLVQLTAVPRIAYAIAVVVNDATVLEQKPKHVNLLAV